LSNQWQEAAAAAAKAGKPAPKKPVLQKMEPAPKIELSSEGVSSGKRAMKITFFGQGEGRRYPTVSAPSPLADWKPYKTLLADVTASRTCMIIFRVMDKTDKFGQEGEGARWEFAARLEPGRNAVVAALPVKTNEIKTVQIFMYNPKEGEVVYVDNLRVSTAKSKTRMAFQEPKGPESKYKVLGTDLEVSDINELAAKLKDKWVKPDDKTVEQVEAEVKAEYEKIKKDHPKAVLVMLRDGQKGYDPADPEKVFAGWEDAGTYNHSPMAGIIAHFRNDGKSATIETTFRGRAGFLRVDLSSIPKGVDILGARFIVSNTHAAPFGNSWEIRPTMFAAEPCNRPWKECEVNAFEYAKDQFWKEFCGKNWGDDGDFSALFLAHGPSGGKTSSWDFTNAVKYWTDGKHPNQGFALHGGTKTEYIDFIWISTRECKDVTKRPGLAVIYEPKYQEKN